MASVAFALGSLELRTLLVTDQSGTLNFPSYFRLRLATSVFAVLLLAAIGFTNSPATASAIVIVSCGRGMEALSDVIYAQMQVIGRLERIGIGQILRASLSIVLLSGSLAAGLPGIACIAAVVLASLTTFFLYDAPGLRQQGIPIRTATGQVPHHYVRIALTGLPFAAISMMAASVAAMPRLTMARESGESAVGVVAALSYLAVAPNLLVTALGQAGMHSLSASFASGDGRGALAGAGKLVFMAAAVGCCTLAAAVVGGGGILHCVYGSRFAGYEWELVLFLGAGAIAYLNASLGYCLTSARITLPQIPMMAVVCAVTFVACTLSIRRWGVAGAAVGQAAGLLVQLSWSAFLFIQKFHAPMRRREALSSL